MNAPLGSSSTSSFLTGISNAAGPAVYTPPRSPQRADATGSGVVHCSNSAISALAPLRILAVDDELPIGQLIKMFLSRDGHAVETASDAVLGLARALSENWDIILVDRAMPKMSGSDLAMEIKRHKPQLPIVLVSGSPEWASVASDRGAGFDAVVRKPFTVANLREGIARALRICLTP